MRRAFLLAATSLVLLGCPNGGGNDGGTGGGSGGGGGGSGGASGFNIQTLDTTTGEKKWIAMAYDSAANRIAIAYYVKLTTTTMNFPDFALKYIEWRNGTVSAAETIVPRVQLGIGLSIAFDPTTNEPVVGYLGGGDEQMTFIWLQSDMMIARRSAAGTWTEQTIAIASAAVCGNAVSDRGNIAGVWPAITFDSTGKLYVFWRDVHNGQFPQQDWAGSDVEGNEVIGTGVTNICVAEGGNAKSAWGGRINAVLGANNQPMIIFDRCDITGAEAEGRDVIWMRRTAAGTWTGPRTAQGVGNTQTGASLAYDALAGDGGTYGIAVVDKGTNVLKYIESNDGEGWTFPDSVYGSGSGGWYPSLAFDPMFHEPAIAWYLCAKASGVDESVCPASEDELRVSQRIGVGAAATWRTVLVDVEGGWLPKLGFLANGKRFVVYRGKPNYDLKLAIER